MVFYMYFSFNLIWFVRIVSVPLILAFKILFCCFFPNCMLHVVVREAEYWRIILLCHGMTCTWICANKYSRTFLVI